MIRFERDPAAFARQRAALVPGVCEEYRRLEENAVKALATAGFERHEYGRRMLRIFERNTPEWLEEIAAAAAVFGTDPEDYLAVIGVRDTSPILECTSWVVMPDSAARGRMLLHKNRDSNSRQLQAWVIRETPGRRKWCGVVEAPDALPLSGMNADGVAGVMNCGELCTERSAIGFSSRALLRVVLERCGSAREAVELIVETVKSGLYAHGKSGSIFMFADGKAAFVVECTAAHAVWGEVPFGIEVRSNSWHLPGLHIYSRPWVSEAITASSFNRRCRALRELQLRAPHITIADSRALAREQRPLPELPGTAICAEVTKFGVTFELDGRASFASVMCGAPECAPAVPLSPVSSGVPDAFADGTFSRESFSLRARKLRLRSLEEVETARDAEMAAAVAAGDSGRADRVSEAGAAAAIREMNDLDNFVGMEE